MIAALEVWWDSFTVMPMAIVIAALAIGLTSCFVSVRRIDGGGWRALFVLACLGYLLSFCLFVHPLRMMLPRGEAILVTPGATAAALASLDLNSDLFVTDQAALEPAVRQLIEYRRVRAAAGRIARVTSAGDTVLFNDPSSRLRIVGDGLDAAQWYIDTFPGAVVVEPSAALPLVLSAEWPQQLAGGAVLSVAVRWIASTPGDTWRLRIQSTDNETLASADVEASAGALMAHTLDVVALSPGRHVLSLQLMRPGDDHVAASAPIAVRVVRPLPARLLLLQAAPSFEWRALRRWAEANATPYASRIAISKERYRHAFSRMDAMDIDTIDSALLAQFDAVLADGAAFGALSAEEQAFLMAGEHGAGLVLLLADEADVEGLPPPLQDALTPIVGERMIYRLSSMGDAVASGLSRLAYQFDERYTHALVVDDQQRAIAVTLGDHPNVVLSLVRDSYRLVGAGRADRHAQLWSNTIVQVSRSAEPAVLRTSPRLVREHERWQLCTADETDWPWLDVVDADGARAAIPLLRTPWRPRERCGWWWPERAGWQQLFDPTGVPLDERYVFASNDWVSWRASQRREATLARSARGASADASTDRIEVMPMRRDWPLVMLLTFALLAWLVQRLATIRMTRRTMP